MSDQTTPEVASLKRCVPFRDLSDTLIAKVALLSKGVSLAQGDSLEVPEDPEAPFYMVLEGKVRVEEEQTADDRPALVLKQGEFFGAHAVLYGKSFNLKVVAVEPARLIKLEARLIKALLQQEPTLQTNLRDASIMYRRLHGKHFRWVDPEEMVQEILHEHPVYLLVGMAQAIGIVLLGLLASMFGLWTGSTGLATIFATIGIGIIGLGFLWGVWQYIDWDNDYYVVTDRRIAWVEQVVGLYDSRSEILLSEVRSVEPETEFLGRMLGYADLFIKDNFQRLIIFKHIRNHLEVKNAIEVLSVEAKKTQTQLDRSAVDGLMRGWITQPLIPSPEKPAVAPAAATPAKKKSLSLRMREYFDVRMRLQEGNTIIYRRHIIFLLYRQAPALLSGLLLLVMTLVLIQARLAKTITFPSVLTTLLTGTLALVVCGLWALYHFEDWRNDTYHILPDKVIVRQKKPLDIDKRTELALLVEDREEVIGLEHQRTSFPGVLLNYGDVLLTVKIPGETQVRKINRVFDPARVHQDIFDRIYYRKRKKAQEELVKTGQLKDWFAAYHRQSEELRRLQNRNLNSPDSGVK